MNTVRNFSFSKISVTFTIIFLLYFFYLLPNQFAQTKIYSNIFSTCIPNPDNPDECKGTTNISCLQLTTDGLVNIHINKKFGESIYDITSTITVSCKNPDGATIVYPIPENAVFIKASGKYSSKPQTNNPTEINWFLDPSAQTKNSSGNYVFNVTIETSNEGFIKTSADLINYQESNLSSSGGNQESNSNNCGGKYTKYMQINPSHKNFGDPNCEIANSKDELYKAIKQIDSKYADRWFYSIMPIESGYNPNAVNLNSQSGKGAYGLVQMNPSGQGNGPYDAGNVYWATQLSNAVTYNRNLDKNVHPDGTTDAWRYWAAARPWWRQPL